MNSLRLECLKLGWLTKKWLTEREKNPEGYLPLNRISPNHVQPPDHHCCCKDDLNSLTESLGDLLVGEDDHV